MGLLSRARDEVVTALSGRRPLALALAVLVGAMPLWLMAGTAPADIAVSLSAILFLWHSVEQRDFTWARRPWLAVGIAVWAYLVASSAFAADVSEALRRALPWGRFLLFAAVAGLLFAESPALRRITLILLSVMVLFVAGDTLLQFRTGEDLFGQEVVRGRLTGPLSKLIVGTFLVYLSQPFLAFALRSVGAAGRTWPRRLLAAAGIVVVCAAVTVSGERMALLLFLFALAVTAVLVVRPWKALAAVATLGLALPAGLLIANPALLQRQASTLAEADRIESSIYGRIWAAAWDVFLSNPLVGVGLRNFRSTCAQHLAGAEAEAVCGNLHPHQMWLEWLVETGLLGTLGMTLMFALLLGAALRRWRLWRWEPLMMGGFVAVLIKLWPVATAGSFFTNRNATIFWFTAALLGAAARMRQPKA